MGFYYLLFSFYLLLSPIRSFKHQISIIRLFNKLELKLQTVTDSQINDYNLPNGFTKLTDISQTYKKPKIPIPVNSIVDLKSYIRKGYRVRDLDVRGNTTMSISNPVNHPVIKLLYNRKNNITSNSSNSSEKIALVLEGGGMRGVVGAGMVSAVWYLGLSDSIDIVYGSSAGSLVGAYFIANQLPYYGPEIYYKYLAEAKDNFIDKKQLLRSIGLGLFDFRPNSFKQLFTSYFGKPVLNLDYLLNNIVQNLQPLNWNLFWSKQIGTTSEKKQILKVVTSGLISKRSILLTAKDNNFKTLIELTNCLRASMLIPGITGDVVRLYDKQLINSPNLNQILWKEYNNNSRINSNMIEGSEPLSDAFIFEPIPDRSAITDNCTHILVMRTRADNLTVTAKMSFLEKTILKRYFGRKLKLPHIAHWMINQVYCCFNTFFAIIESNLNY